MIDFHNDDDAIERMDISVRCQKSKSRWVIDAVLIPRIGTRHPVGREPWKWRSK
jgi:hypothetical protein